MKIHNEELEKVVLTGLKKFRKATSHIRVLPDFLIIGVQKGGTTSLFRYLVKHPEIRKPFLKELYFFDKNYKQNPDIYRTFFPTKFEKKFKNQIFSQNLISGEGTPNYFFYPKAPGRIKKMIPKSKFILLLRNPIDRAYSHYNHLIRFKLTDLSFEKAIEKEQNEFEVEKAKVIANDNYWSPKLMRYSILKRGEYYNNLMNWLKYFPPDQFLIIRSEDFYKNPKKIYSECLKFLGVRKWYPKEFKHYNMNYYRKIDSITRKRLKEYYKSHNEKLSNFLGRDFEWG